jgi:hypothetical protein
VLSVTNREGGRERDLAVVVSCGSTSLLSSWCGGAEESGAAILVAVAGAITGLWCPVVDIGVDGYSNVSCVLC